MKNLKILLLILIISSLSMSAKFIALLKDGSLIQIQNNTFISKEDGTFTISDINVDLISKIYNEVDKGPDTGDNMTPPSSYKMHGCVLDINNRNSIVEDSDDGRYVYSAEYMMEIAGIPYFTTDDIDEALSNSSLILVSSYIREKTFSNTEIEKIEKWIEDGGVFIASALEFNKQSRIFELFGITSVNPKVKTHTLIKWIDGQHDELIYFDEPEEKETYIGENYIYTSEYTLSTAIPLAYYDDSNTVAVTKNKIGEGCAYNIGLRWRDVIQRNQLNKGGKNRYKNNNFDASADMFPLFVRAAYISNNDVVAWKHTIPDGYETVLIPTHDCDSRSALDEMFWLADYEQSLGLKAHYFITTHYFRQPNYMSAFYTEETYPSCIKLISQGHTVGSHSICHYPDFNQTNKFPLTITTPENYAATCTYDVENKESHGGSTWAEIVMSKQLLENVLHNNVRSFRSGHLCVNNNIPQALIMGDYSFTSCYTANDLRCQFPFFQRMDCAWRGELTSILQMPLHYSDVRPSGEEINDDTWRDALPVWIKCHLKLKGNYAPNILLIHPNKKCKMEMQKAFIEMLDLDNVGLYNFEEYGEFWIKRAKIDYDYACEEGVLKIVVDTDDIQQFKGQGITIDTNIEIKNIIVSDNSYKIHSVKIIQKSPSRYIIVI